MRTINDLSEDAKEDLLGSLVNIFEDLGIGMNKGDYFVQGALIHISDRYEIDEEELYEFYLKNR